MKRGHHQAVTTYVSQIVGYDTVYEIEFVPTFRRNLLLQYSDELISFGCRSGWEKETCGLRRKVPGLWPISVTGKVEGVYIYSNGYINPFLQSIHSTLSLTLTHVCSS
jgi:hypothetical protein